MTLTPVGDPEVDRLLAERVEASKATAVVETLPPPEVLQRPPTMEEMASCKSAASLERRAMALGWKVTTWYSRGPLIGADGQQLGRCDCLALVFRWDDPPEAWAVWRRRLDRDEPAWEFGSGWLLGPPVRLASAAVAHWLAGTAPK